GGSLSSYGGDFVSGIGGDWTFRGSDGGNVEIRAGEARVMGDVVTKGGKAVAAEGSYSGYAQTVIGGDAGRISVAADSIDIYGKILGYGGNGSVTGNTNYKTAIGGKATFVKLVTDTIKINGSIELRGGSPSPVGTRLNGNGGNFTSLACKTDFDNSNITALAGSGGSGGSSGKLNAFYSSISKVGATITPGLNESRGFLKVVIKDRDGNPLPGETVTVYQNGTNIIGCREVTDSEGAIRCGLSNSTLYDINFTSGYIEKFDGNPVKLPQCGLGAFVSIVSIERIEPSFYSPVRNGYYSNSQELKVIWNSTEDVSRYIVDYKVTPSPAVWNWWLDTVERSAVFGRLLPAPVTEGNTYSFRARNYFGVSWSREMNVTTDLTGPSCEIIANPYLPRNFTLSWQASDALSGVQLIEVDIKEGDNDWKPLSSLCTVADLQASCSLLPGKYAFRCRASDYARNTGAYSAERNVTVVDGSIMFPLPRWIGSRAAEWVLPKGFRVSWDGYYQSTAISCYNVKWFSGPMGSMPPSDPALWNSLNNSGDACLPESQKSFVFNSSVADNYTYHFIVRATNINGEIEPWPAATNPTENETRRMTNTTVDTIPPSVGIQTFDSNGTALPILNGIINLSQGLEIVVNGADSISGIRKTGISGVRNGRVSTSFSVECPSSECRYKPNLTLDDEITFNASAEDNALNANYARGNGTAIGAIGYPCIGNSSCSSPLICDSVHKACVPPNATACQRDSDCASCQLCDSRLNICLSPESGYRFFAVRHPLAAFAVHNLAFLLGSGAMDIAVNVRNLKSCNMEIELELGGYRLARFHDPSSTFDYNLDGTKRKAKLLLNPREERRLLVAIRPSEFGKQNLVLRATDWEGLQDYDSLRIIIDYPEGFAELDEAFIMLCALIAVAVFYLLAMRKR
ncbi:MAG: hypothetical protein HYX24_03990, partial [Candidatus Aenigmarchaeota archaeon]|nr:hypothetical protein [Candidatus Aenigmarchaeota archaeon]